MKPYASLFKIQFLDGIQYKAAAISGILTQFVWGFINIILFQLLSNGRMPKDQIASYFWLNQMFIALLAIWTMDLSVFRDIENGDIQYRLLRPMNLYLQWFINGAAYRLSRTIIRALPLFLICILLPDPYRLVLPNSFQTMSLFSISILLSLGLQLAIGNIMYSLGLIFKNTLSVRVTFSSIIENLDGSIIPYQFLPSKLTNILKYGF